VTGFRNAHNRIMDPEDPADLKAMALDHHRRLVETAFWSASLGRNVDAELTELEQFEEACREQDVHHWDGKALSLIRQALAAAKARG
jgi:hypothetical protein